MDGSAIGAATDRDRFTGRFVTGNNARLAKQLKIAAKVEQLRREYFPCGGESSIDASRLMLAAKHYVIAEDTLDPDACVRSTRTAEYLLSKVRREEEPLPTVEELLAEADE
jgi:secreted trypsin-like serine protease